MTFTWPLDTNRIRRGLENHTFGNVRKYANGNPKPHQGWDFEATPGTPAYAVAEGTVAFVRDQGDYGRQLCLAVHHPTLGPLWAFYAHLDAILVEPGAAVTAGQLVAHTGRSGNAASLPPEDDHLHFELRTTLTPGSGLADRISPMEVYGTCPLKAANARA